MSPSLVWESVSNAGEVETSAASGYVTITCLFVSGLRVLGENKHGCPTTWRTANAAVYFMYAASLNVISTSSDCVNLHRYYKIETEIGMSTRIIPTLTLQCVIKPWFLLPSRWYYRRRIWFLSLFICWDWFWPLDTMYIWFGFTSTASSTTARRLRQQEKEEKKLLNASSQHRKKRCAQLRQTWDRGNAHWWSCLDINTVSTVGAVDAARAQEHENQPPSVTFK